MSVTATRTYLELRSLSELKPAPEPREGVRVDRVGTCAPAFWRNLYEEVGRAHHWVDRLAWSDDTIRAYLEDPAVSLWVLSVDGAVAGYFELKRDDEGDVEIAYFGLLPAFVGQGLGGHMLTAAVHRAWELRPARVWLHTCSLDHPAALGNYRSRGFTPFRTEEYVPPSL